MIADIGFENLKKFSSALIKYRNKDGWVAPEQLASNLLIISHPAPSNDIYSIGMLIWYLLNEQDPFDIPFEQIPAYVIDKNLRPSIKETTHPKLAQLIRQCWQKDETKRPEIDKILIELNSIKGCII